VGIKAGDDLVVIEGAQRRYVTALNTLGRERVGVGILWGL
jgi:hypothetical protein